MERKLVRQGRNALTVTLPAKWLQKKGLRAGQAVQVEEKNNELVIRTERTAEKKEITLHLEEQPRSLIYHEIIAKYIKGYDRITVHHTNPALVQEVVEMMLGMIIEEHASKKTVFKNIIAVPEEDFSALVRRSCHILLQQARTVAEVAAGQATLEQVKKEEYLLNSNLFYCLRYLNKYERIEHAYAYFLLCATLEEAGDQLKVIAKHIGRNKALANKIAEGIEQYTKGLFKQDITKLYTSLRAFRESIGNKSFVEGLAFSLADALYNNIGYLMPRH